MRVIELFDDLPVSTGLDDDPIHITCDYCSPDNLTGLCGTELKGIDVANDDEGAMCVVCLDLDETHPWDEHAELLER